MAQNIPQNLLNFLLGNMQQNSPIDSYLTGEGFPTPQEKRAQWQADFDKRDDRIRRQRMQSRAEQSQGLGMAADIMNMPDANVEAPPLDRTFEKAAYQDIIQAGRQKTADAREEKQQAAALAKLEQQAAQQAQARGQYYQDNPDYDPYHAMQNAPTAEGRAAAAKMLQDSLKPKRAETATELFNRDPQAYGRMKSYDKPLVTVDTGMKYPKGGMISKAKQLNMGLPTTGQYWDKGDGSPPTKISNFSEAQGKAAGFYHRMKGAGESIDNIAEAYDATSFRDNLTQVGMPQFLSNYASSVEGQQYSVAKRAWLESHLRKESGAVIGAEEMSNADSMYFPMPGDDKETISTKNKARKTVEESVQAQSGGAYSELYPQPLAKPVKRVSYKDYL